jgi:hypothetical protein
MSRKIIVVVISIVIGLALLPVITSFGNSLTAPAVTNTLGTILTTAGRYNGTTVGSLVDLLPILFVILLVVGAIAFVVIKGRKGE